MDRSQFPAGGEQQPKRQLQIQGTRPPPLSVNKESHKIKKPPKPPAVYKEPLAEAACDRRPVIIYAVSPKVVHATVSNFMAVVQGLTGLSSCQFSGNGDVSPAARLAVTEKASPREKRVWVCGGEKEDVMGIVEEIEVELSQVPGILSPSPAMLAPLPAGFFSPGYSDPSKVSIWHELSPFLYGSSFISSPSGLLSAPIVSSNLSPDIFGKFWDF